ncbi:HAD family phosphatase [Kordiimonas sp. SCSIO 12610]|uniref:HAD family hydrolase n=1 Tax=Kordiimonas sp. SCSIO 12610 TaxID=2829597 RepID=UPI00210BA79B|nr:HAD family phosphatase [Kordiimonas sp. SCSIO 12610]UTW55007.1 HAD family phosphatase [Kordiimonas sp. SCSIO 12610]
MRNIDSIIFDIGNVFVDWSPRHLYEQLISDSAELEYFLKNIVTLEWHTEHDKGRPFAEGVRILSEQFPEYAELISAFDYRWDDTIKAKIDGTVRILDRLAATDIELYALTNFSQEKWPAFAEQYEFTRHFKGVVVSGEERMVKPDPRIFNLIIERFNLDPSRTLFVDDRAENVKAGEVSGMIGHLFTGPDDGPVKLEAHLKDVGVL